MVIAYSDAVWLRLERTARLHTAMLFAPAQALPEVLRSASLAAQKGLGPDEAYVRNMLAFVWVPLVEAIPKVSFRMSALPTSLCFAACAPTLCRLCCSTSMLRPFPEVLRLARLACLIRLRHHQHRGQRHPAQARLPSSNACLLPKPGRVLGSV